MILDSSRCPLFHSSQVFHKLLWPFSVVLPQNFFYLCDKRRELRKKRFEPEGSEKNKEVNNKTKRCMKKAKENWIGEQICEIEESLRKNNSKRAYQFVKDYTTVKQGKATTVQDRSEKCLTEARQILNR